MGDSRFYTQLASAEKHIKCNYRGIELELRNSPTEYSQTLHTWLMLMISQTHSLGEFGIFIHFNTPLIDILKLKIVCAHKIPKCIQLRFQYYVLDTLLTRRTKEKISQLLSLSPQHACESFNNVHQHFPLLCSCIRVFSVQEVHIRQKYCTCRFHSNMTLEISIQPLPHSLSLSGAASHFLARNAYARNNERQ